MQISTMILILILLLAPTLVHATAALSDTYKSNETKTLRAPDNGTVIITAPSNSTISNVTVSVFQPKFLSGTWTFVNNHGNISGVIVFGNQDLCPNCRWDWQHTATFSGIFSVHHAALLCMLISGTYTWQYSPASPGFAPVNISDLSLMYNYHHKDVEVMGNLTVINPSHMELNHIDHWRVNEENVLGSDYRVATGLHLHQGDVIYLVKGGN
jgi:hypothetical protein